MCGTQIKTINPNHRKLFFMKPCLGSKGLEARRAQEKYEFLQKRGRLESQTDKDYQAEIEHAAIEILCASLRQQYLLLKEDPKSSDGKKLEDMTEAEVNAAWADTISNYFVEGDIERIIFSMRLEKEFSYSEMLDEIKRQQKYIKESIDIENKEKN